MLMVRTSMLWRIASDLYAEIIKLRPAWQDNALNKGIIKVVMTASSSDGSVLAKRYTPKEQRKQLAERMRDDTDPLRLAGHCAGSKLYLLFIKTYRDLRFH